MGLGQPVRMEAMSKIRSLFIVIGIISCFIIVPVTVAKVGSESEDEDLNPNRTMLMLGYYFNGDIITGVETGGQKLVALTFDDGPDPRYTPKILAMLKHYQIKATFFVVGENAHAHPGIVRQAYKEGHEIANHTYTHPSLNKNKLADVAAEIVSAQDLVEGMIGRYPQYFRPPRRLYNHQVIKAAHACNLQVVLWTVCVENHSCPTPEKMAARVLKRMRPGTIILAHDGLLPRDQTLHALPEIIEGYQSKGYTFVTLSELMAAGEQ